MQKLRLLYSNAIVSDNRDRSYGIGIRNIAQMNIAAQIISNNGDKLVKADKN